MKKTKTLNPCCHGFGDSLRAANEQSPEFGVVLILHGSENVVVASDEYFGERIGMGLFHHTISYHSNDDRFG